MFGIKEIINIKGKNVPKWVEELGEVLPHGSGIDLDWQIEYRGDYIIARNSYHCMDENGMYDGWQDFSIVIEKDEYKGEYRNNIRLHFHNGHYKADKYMLRYYLEDYIYYCLEKWQWKKGLIKGDEIKMAHGFKYKRLRRQTAAKLLQTQRRENFDKMMEKFESEKRRYME